jgi:hypothetical protein
MSFSIIQNLDYDKMLNRIDDANDHQISQARDKLFSKDSVAKSDCFLTQNLEGLIPIPDDLEDTKPFLQSTEAHSPHSTASVSSCESDPLVIGAHNIETTPLNETMDEFSSRHTSQLDQLEKSPLPSVHASLAPFMGTHFDFLDLNRSFNFSPNLPLHDFEEAFMQTPQQSFVPSSASAHNAGMSVENLGDRQTAQKLPMPFDVKPAVSELEHGHVPKSTGQKRSVRKRGAVKKQNPTLAKKKVGNRNGAKGKADRVSSGKFGSDSAVVPRTPRRVPDTNDSTAQPKLEGYVDVDDGNESMRSNTPASTPCADELGCSKEEERWPLSVLEGSIENLRTYARRNYLSTKDIATLKADRRRFKGRQYSSASRMSKKVLLDELEKSRGILEKREGTIRSLKSKVDNEKRLVQAYRKILADLKVQDPYKSQ